MDRILVSEPEARNQREDPGVKGKTAPQLFSQPHQGRPQRSLEWKYKQTGK